MTLFPPFNLNPEGSTREHGALIDQLRKTLEQA